MELYEKFRKVPNEAQKTIGGGRLKGMTDINPMWRIKVLTEAFGPIGFGWYYTIDRQWIETADAGERSAFVNITLFVKLKEEWSKGIAGTGGSMFITNEKNGPYTNDECFKMALTDAISVSCKALGIGADIYWNKDNTKYTAGPEKTEQDPLYVTETQISDLLLLDSIESLQKGYNSLLEFGATFRKDQNTRVKKRKEELLKTTGSK